MKRFKIVKARHKAWRTPDNIIFEEEKYCRYLRWKFFSGR